MSSRLYRAARRFDKTPCKDAYTGSLSFNGQLLPWDESTRDSESAQRRVVSTAPDSVKPSRGVVTVDGETYILGRPHYDQHNGVAMRMGYPAVLADGLMTARTIEQVCLNQPGVSLYASKAWVKNDAFTEQDSKLNPKHHVHFSADENIGLDYILVLQNVMMVVRAIVTGTSGVKVATADEMSLSAVENALVVNKTFNPVTEAHTSTPVAVRAVRMRWQSLFSYQNDAAPVFNPGDIQVAVAKSVVTPVSGSTITLSDGDWKVESVVSTTGVWLCKASREG